jgi:hypothetical protein
MSGERMETAPVSAGADPVWGDVLLGAVHTPTGDRAALIAAGPVVGNPRSYVKCD